MTVSQLTLPDASPWSPPEPDPRTQTYEWMVLRDLREAHAQGFRSCDRAALVFLTGLTDRKVREAVASLQALGWPIVSLAKGYRLASSADAEQYAAREERRALTILAKVRRIREAASRAA